MTANDNRSPGENSHAIAMFAGKGGVGKTTCAAATALHYSLLGEPTLALSTDPTPSLSHIFEVKDGQKPVKVTDTLYLAELGVDEVKKMWDRKFGREVYEVFSSFVSVSYEDFVDFLTSILPGLRDEFTVDYIKHLVSKNGYRRFVWDTAPLGQTLGLLETPSMLSKHLKPAPRIYSRLKLASDSKRPVLDIIKGWEKLAAEDMIFLRNDVKFIMVTIPEALAFKQLDGIISELGRYGVIVRQLIINNVVKDLSSAFLRTRARQQQSYIDMLYDKYAHLDIVEIPMFSEEIKGLERLKLVEQAIFQDKSK